MSPEASSASRPRLAGLVLAGGKSSRMGREKAFVPLGGRPVLAHVLDRLKPQVARVAISANGDPARFASFGLPILADLEGTAGCGPLAGILAGLAFARSEGLTGVATVPSDAPFLPRDLVSRLTTGSTLREIAFAESSSGPEPLFSVWPNEARGAVIDALARGEFSVVKLLARLERQPTLFEPAQPDPFFNLNKPQDVETAERWFALGGVR